METVFTALVNLEKDTAQLNWRVNLCVIQSFERFPDFFDSDAEYEQTASILMRKLLEVPNSFVHH